MNRPFLYCSKDGEEWTEGNCSLRIEQRGLRWRQREGEKKEVEKSKEFFGLPRSHLGRGLLLLLRGGVASNRESKLGLLDELDTLGDRSGQLGKAGGEELLLVRREVAERVELLNAVGLWRRRSERVSFTGSKDGRKRTRGR